MKRPTSVTVIAWIIVVMGGLSVFATAASITSMARDRSLILVPVEHFISYVGMLTGIVSGIAMLKGCNWARFLYVVWNAIDFVVGMATSSTKAAVIPGLVIFVGIAYFLFRPKATEYFAPAESSSDAQRV